jgi:2-polyprenyl-6-methoxyphenol hydroxylase-like FAD-dependent oxidoreductase
MREKYGYMLSPESTVEKRASQTPAPKRHVEIAGGGLGGLAAAASLAQRGWSVRIHERADRIRASGSGIYIAENGVRVLEAIGAHHEALREGYRFYRRELRDDTNRAVHTDVWPPEDGFRVYVLRLETLVQALLNVALQHGVDICYSSRVECADPAGVLHLTDGTSLKADLVIGADGVHSRVRQNLKIEGTKKSLRSGAIRAIVPRLNDEHLLQAFTYMELWNGIRRMFYAPISRNESFVALMTLDRDTKGSREPPDLDTWKESFPFMSEILDRFVDPLPWAPFIEVKLKSWSRGKVALVGDAAHAMSPNLGQGGGTAMMDGLSLAYNLNRPGLSVEEGLALWEQRHRPVVDRVQLASYFYGTLAQWPILPRRFGFFLLGKSPWIQRQRFAAAHHIPDGADQTPKIFPPLVEGTA